jgi:hypothetical protein
MRTVAISEVIVPVAMCELSMIGSRRNAALTADYILLAKLEQNMNIVKRCD